MEKTRRTDIFFKNIRLFSIIINAKKIIARVYRASSLIKEDDFIFFYDDFYIFYKYNRDDTCLFIYNIFIKYGVAKLHGVLKITFKEISK
jgi:hypothetical protein